MPFPFIDQPHQLGEILGVMLYPEASPHDRDKARIFDNRFSLCGFAMQSKSETSLCVRQTVRRVFQMSQSDLPDIEHRLLGGSMVGEIMKTYFYLAHEDEEQASWTKAQDIAYRFAGPIFKRGVSVPQMRKQRKLFGRVIHMWAALEIRDYKFSTRLNVGYDLPADIDAFLKETEILRRWGQAPPQQALKRYPPLSDIDVLRPSDDWRPARRHPDWPYTGALPDLAVSPDLERRIKPGGRPRTVSSR